MRLRPCPWRRRRVRRAARASEVVAGERRRATKAAACGSGVRLFSVTSDGTLMGEMKRYVKDMSNLQNAGGGRSANLCFYD